MKKLLLSAVAGCIGAAGVIGAAAAADIGISINVAQPGFYGRIDLGAVPTPPPLLMRAPVVVEQAPMDVPREPVYLHVPPGHEKHWAQHCREYNACGVPVYFVQDRWYNEVYVPHARVAREPVRDERREEYRDEYREMREEPHGNGHGKDQNKGRGKGHDRDDRDDRGHEQD
jgi:hypothetical protein